MECIIEATTKTIKFIVENRWFFLLIPSALFLWWDQVYKIITEV